MPRLVCQQCGKQWLGGGFNMVCVFCEQWCKGITPEEYEEINKAINGMVEGAKEGEGSGDVKESK